MDKEGGGSWKLDSFHGRHMCIIPKVDISGDCFPLTLFRSIISIFRHKYLRYKKTDFVVTG